MGIIVSPSLFYTHERRPGIVSRLIVQLQPLHGLNLERQRRIVQRIDIGQRFGKSDGDLVKFCGKTLLHLQEQYGLQFFLHLFLE